MNNSMEKLYGNKCIKLITLKQNPKYSNIIPDIYPIDTSYAIEFLSEYTGISYDYESLVNTFTNELSIKRPDLIESIEKVCNDFPWIIRSSGFEDLDENPNAGVYESLVCNSKEEFFYKLSQVVFSGFKHIAIKQFEFNNQSNAIGNVIPVFIQPLITDKGKINNTKEVPYFSNEQLKKIKETIIDLHKDYKMEVMDCEWVIDADEGIISATSITKFQDNKISGQMAFGFNLFSTQHSTNNLNSTVFWFVDSDINLWQGDFFRQVNINNNWLVQMRYGGEYSLSVEVECLKDTTNIQLKNWLKIRADDVIIAGKKIRLGTYIEAINLNQAWQKYLNLDSECRNKVSAIFVKNGTRTEHAGIMFAQASITVMKLENLNLIGYGNQVIVDPLTLNCYFNVNNISENIDIKVDSVKYIGLPSNCSLIFEKTIDQDLIINFNVSDYNSMIDFVSEITSLNTIKGLSSKQKENILKRSIYPSPQYFLKCKETIKSPTIFAIYLEQLHNMKLIEEKKIVLLGIPEFAREYYQVYLANAGYVDLTSFLPKLSKINLLLVNSLVKIKDINLNWNLLKLELKSNDISQNIILITLEKIINMYPASKDNILTTINSILEFSLELEELPIYQSSEKIKIYSILCNSIEQFLDNDMQLISEVLYDYSLPPHCLVQMISSINNKNIVIEYNRLKKAIIDFKEMVFDVNLREKALYLNEVYKKFICSIDTIKDQETLKACIYNEIVELYDVSAKNILLNLSNNRNNFMYKLYIDLMSYWLDFISLHNVSYKSVFILKEWLYNKRESLHEIKDFYLKDIHWKVIIKNTLENKSTIELELENPHQLNNVLHQWSLSLMTTIPIKQLPNNLSHIINFANTFSEQKNRLLRFNRDFFEIELAMCTHKSSLVFGDKYVNVEFSEPPESDDNEIARLLAFDAFIEKYNKWYPEYKFIHCYEKIIGSWTIFISILPTKNEKYNFFNYERIFHIIRFLFDSAYDFSHESVKKVENISNRFHEEQWKEIFSALIEYRGLIDDNAQFSDLKAYSISTFFTNLCSNEDVEAYFLNSYKMGYKKALQWLRNLNTILENENDIEKWRTAYIQTEAMSLLLASVWFEKTLLDLEKLNKSSFVYDIVCRNLLKRSDVYTKLKKVSNGDKIMYRDLVLHYIPHLCIESENINELAEYVCRFPKQYKRCKQFMIHKFCSVLNEENKAKIINDIDYVPFGCNEFEENMIQLVLTKDKGRFDICNTILFVQ